MKHDSASARHTSRAKTQIKVSVSLPSRLRGPGGLYNTGNFIGLVSGGVSAWIAGSSFGRAGWESVIDDLTGSSTALTLTAATAIFFIRGEVYHRAFDGARHLRDRRIRQGDLLSAISAILLGVFLAVLGHPWLALASGLLHGLSKLGSALHRPGPSVMPIWPTAWIDPFRALVIASRDPALFAASASLLAPFPSGQNLLAPSSPLVSYLPWLAADLRLLQDCNSAISDVVIGF